MKKLPRLFGLLFGCLLLLSGCGTTYQKYSGWTKMGYTESLLTDNMAIINFKSSRDDAEEAVINGSMRRAAELAIEKGYTGFIVMDDGGQTNEGVVSAGGTFNSFSANGMTTGSYAPMLLFYKNGNYRMTIKMVNSTGDTVFNAKEVMRNTATFFGLDQ